jgi:phospholipase C
VFVITFDEWGGFYDHVPPPKVTDDTNPADVDHTGDGTTPTDGRLIPDYTQLGFRVPAIVVSNLARPGIVHHGPYEHSSTLALIESTFGLPSLTARDANARNLGEVLRFDRRRPVPPGVIPTSDQVPGPVDAAAAVCSATSVQSVSPAPVRHGKPSDDAGILHRPGWPTGSGMAGFGKEVRSGKTEFRPGPTR